MQESTAIEEEADPAEVSGYPPPPPAVAAADAAAAADVPESHPNYDRDEPFLPGFRGHGGGYGGEKWDPDKPPCIPSDERPDTVLSWHGVGVRGARFECFRSSRVGRANAGAL